MPEPHIVPTTPGIALEQELPAQHDPPDVAPPPPKSTRRFNLKGRTLREHSARGMLINTGFLVVLSTLQLARGFVLAIFLSRTDYGVWGILAVSLGTLLWLKQVGIGDKYLQQDDPDQELAFQKAFTLEAMFTGIFMGLLLVVVPLLGVIYGEWQLLAPGLVILLVLPANVLQTPLWVHYRNMDFFKQRIIQSIDPVVGFAVALGFAIAGAGYWALAAGVLAGAWTTAVVAFLQSPYRLRFRYDRGTMTSYFSFSWPLFVANGSSMIIAQTAVIAMEASHGLAAVGAMSLASHISGYTQRIDHLITGTLYPAICAVRDRLDLLYESFVKSNRLALMWAVPFGIGLALFIGDLVTFVLGEKWRPATEILQITGFNGALGHIAYNWDAYMRALGRTKPIAVASATSMAVFVGAGLPLMLTYGLRGLAIGIVLQTAANIVVRVFYLRQLFHGFSYLTQALRSLLPGVPALAMILVVRAFTDVERTALMACAELAAYIIVSVASAWVFERHLLREALGYLGRARAATVAA